MEKITLPDHIQYWLTEAKHDCFFVVGPKNGPTERIGALKCFLMGYSKPFRAMLQESELAEKKDIRMIDVEPTTFWNFLKCVYGVNSDVIKTFSFEENAKLLYLAEKYMADDIKTQILGRLISLFSYANIYLALSHPVCYCDKELKQKILQELQIHFHEMVADGRFLNLPMSALLFILEELKYSSLKEIQIWDATLKWAKHQTDSTKGEVLRPYIFKLLKFIRFLAMDYRDFWAKVVKSQVLDKEEVYEICRSFGTGEPHNIKHLSESNNSRNDKAGLGLGAGNYVKKPVRMPLRPIRYYH